MTIVPVSGTVSNLSAVRQVARHAMRGRRLRLVIDDESPIDLPDPVSEALAVVVSILSRGRPG